MSSLAIWYLILIGFRLTANVIFDPIRLIRSVQKQIPLLFMFSFFVSLYEFREPFICENEFFFFFVFVRLECFMEMKDS